MFGFSDPALVAALRRHAGSLTAAPASPAPAADPTATSSPAVTACDTTAAAGARAGVLIDDSQLGGVPPKPAATSASKPRTPSRQTHRRTPAWERTGQYENSIVFATDVASDSDTNSDDDSPIAAAVAAAADSTDSDDMPLSALVAATATRTPPKWSAFERRAIATVPVAAAAAPVSPARTSARRKSVRIVEHSDSESGVADSEPATSPRPQPQLAESESAQPEQKQQSRAAPSRLPSVSLMSPSLRTPKVVRVASGTAAKTSARGRGSEGGVRGPAAVAAAPSSIPPARAGAATNDDDQMSGVEEGADAVMPPLWYRSRRLV